MSELYEKLEALQNGLVEHVTGGRYDSQAYRQLRSEIINHPLLKDVVPPLLRSCRTVDEFWPFIKAKFPTYAGRRKYIWDEFRPLFDRVESVRAAPADLEIAGTLKRFNTESVHEVWIKATERRESDPEGAITLARTLLETVCKHILDEHGAAYDAGSDLSQLYKMAAKVLNLSPNQHSESIFKQILGGCASVVAGLGALRNCLSDAHGRGKKSVRPASRHAELAVNLSGAVATFLVATHQSQKSSDAS